jgi:RND superfamily putative drug exporter
MDDRSAATAVAVTVPAMRALARIVAGRRTKWLVVVAWVLLAVVFAPLGAKLGDVTDNRTETFLPPEAESTEVLRLEEQRFAGGETVGGLVVYRRAGGLTAADRARIVRDAQRLARALPLIGRPVVPFAPGSPQALVSPRGDVAYTVINLPDDNERLGQWGETARDIARTGGGVDVYVTGPLGFNADFNEVFETLDTKVLWVTVVLVLVLLGLIYRSPLIALIPLVVVGFAYSIAQGLVYLYGQTGNTVSENGTSILVVLMFGVGTDYCLLLVARYREELRRFPDKHDAMGRAVRRAGPAIVASGLTVALTMLTLLLADVGSTHSLGPVSAIGVAVALLAGMTLLPALLTIAGRRGFWPRRATVEPVGDATAGERVGIWRRIGERVVRRPSAALAVTVGAFALSALGLLAYREDYSIGGAFKEQTESLTGFQIMQEAFPPGALAPTTVLVDGGGGPPPAAAVAGVQRALRTVRGVAAVTPAGASSDGRIARLSVVFADDPFEESSLERVEAMRDRVAGATPRGIRVLVGDGSAVQADFNAAAARDLRVIVPLALLVIFVILAVLLQALVAPVVLIASVVLSFLGTLGLSIVVFRFVFGDTGVDNSLPTYAFIFLTALGIDYTIFLMSRVREEARRVGTQEGTLVALAATGPVITSAGIILAGTFSVLLTLPITFIFDLGFMVAVGILLDTFVVRTIMVPASIELLGDRAWWPSTAAGGTRALHEAGSPEHPGDPKAEAA